MLRASARDTDADVDIQAIGGDEVSADQGIEFGSQLMRFAEAVAGRDERSISAACGVGKGPQARHDFYLFQSP